MNKNRALVAVWIGINDVNDSLNNSTEGYLELWERIIKAVFEQTVKRMYDTGYYNFLILNLPPLDRTPHNQRTSKPLPNATMVEEWNIILARHIESFSKTNDGAKMMLYDANRFLNGVMDDPATYGIKNTTSYCAAYQQLDVLKNPARHGCQPLNEYFWYNQGHMSSHTHKVMAPHLAQFLGDQSE